jgi:hypothetical protein
MDRFLARSFTIEPPSIRDTEGGEEVKSVVIVRILFSPNVLEIVVMAVASDSMLDDTDGRICCTSSFTEPLKTSSTEARVECVVEDLG